MTNEDRMGAEAETISDGNDGQRKDYPAEVKTASGTSNVVRILDGSGAYRKYWISWFMCDDDQVRPFIVENETEGRSILGNMLGDPENYFQGGYLESKKGQFGKVFIHQAKDPELFKRLTEYWNPSYNGTGTCKPSKEYVYNVLHRNPETDPETGKTSNWCIENTHTKLMKFKQRAFKSLKVVRDNCGEFHSYDIVFSKQGSGSDTFFSSMKADVMTQYNKVGDISPEEKAYGKYDLDLVTRLSSAGYALANLHKQIERIEMVMGKSWILEFERQKAMEDQAYAQAQSGAIPGTPLPATAPSAPVQAPIPSGRVPVSATSAPIRTPVSSTPLPSTPLVPCGHCKELIPDGLDICPKCKGTLLAACDTCHKPFSMFANVCPYCKTEYRTA